MSLERGLQITPVDILDPREAAILDEFAIDLLVLELVLVEFVGVFGVFEDRMNAVLFVMGFIMLETNVVFADKAGCVSALSKDRADVHVVLFQGDVEGGERLISQREFAEEFFRMR